ncbi:DedA family protein [Nocardioides sp. GXQ0305]|uniref:DedA family protein n=1 Tax=Nocardioides sp. GXQ0305 TaxID=3423912 RepID=UPI003D7E75D0
MSPVLDWIVTLMRTIGAPGVGVATALETVFPPVPSEVVLPLAGFTASQGHYDVVAAVLWATGGSVAGALVLYWLGVAWGVDPIKATAERLPLIGADDVQRAIEWFGDHDRRSVFFGRLVPGVRSLISIPAGVDRMPLPTFIGYTTAGSLLWNAALIGAGYLLGSQWHLVETWVGDVSGFVYVVLAALVVVFVARRLRHRHGRR